LVFPLFPVGRAKFFSQRNLDAAHISPGEICGLNSAGITGIDLGVMAAFAVLLGIFSRTGFRITRSKGFLMLAGYADFVVWLVSRA